MSIKYLRKKTNDKTLNQVGLWIVTFFITGLRVIVKAIRLLPQSLIKWLFSGAIWVKTQLDKRINSTQREHLHTIVF